MKPSIAIIGCGIGGAALTLSLHRAGFDVHVYEQAPELKEVGAGLALTPNATRILHDLGLADQLAKTAVSPDFICQRRWDDGRLLTKSPTKEPLLKEFGFPFYTIHRADLLSSLVEAIPYERIHLDHRCKNFTQEKDRVKVTFENGAEIEADLLIGADGIHSNVRSTLFGPENPRFTGCTAYRGLVSADRIKNWPLGDPEQELLHELWLGPGKHVVNYFIRSKKLISYVAIIEEDDWTRESWRDECKVEEVVSKFEGWHPQLLEILKNTDKVFIQALLDRAPLDQWSSDRVTLLGDACHPMLPFMGQGAAQAIEDGAALTALLVNNPKQNVKETLHQYEQIRLPRTSHIQGISGANKKRFHLPDGSEQIDRDSEMAKETTDWSFENIRWIYAHDAKK